MLIQERSHFCWLQWKQFVFVFLKLFFKVNDMIKQHILGIRIALCVELICQITSWIISKFAWTFSGSKLWCTIFLFREPFLQQDFERFFCFVAILYQLNDGLMAVFRCQEFWWLSHDLWCFDRSLYWDHIVSRDPRPLFDLIHPLFLGGGLSAAGRGQHMVLEQIFLLFHVYPNFDQHIFLK